jgi:hypothetical protein
MFLQIWNLIQAQQLELAEEKLKTHPFPDEYSQNVALLLEAEIAVRRSLFVKAIELATLAYPYFIQLEPTCDDLGITRSDLKLDFLEKWLMQWIFARALAGEKRWEEANTYVTYTLYEWKLFINGRAPFIDYEAVTAWNFFPEEISTLDALVREKLNIPPSKETFLKLLTPDGFQPKPFKYKENGLTSAHPLVSVIFDGDPDIIHSNAGYDHYEIVTSSSKPAKGALIISLEPNMIPSRDFIAKTVELFCSNSEVSLLRFGIACSDGENVTRKFYENEVPLQVHALGGFKAVNQSLYHKPGISIAQSLGHAYAITKNILSSAPKNSIGIYAFLHGYTLYAARDISCIWNEELVDTNMDKKPILDALSNAYLYFSKHYFEGYFVPWLKNSHDKASFEEGWKAFQENLPLLETEKNHIWQNAVRSMREYWLEYWEHIYGRCNEEEKLAFGRDFGI